MIRIVDVASSGNSKTFGTPENILLDRDIYRRLQQTEVSLLGNANEDTKSSLVYFISEMEKINSGDLTNLSAVAVDEFLSTLGMTQYYPHRDNTYIGDLNG